MVRTKEAKVIPFPKRQQPPPRFDSVSVLISSFEARELAGMISAKAEALERDLADDAKALKEGVTSFVVTMAGGRQDELSGAGVRFKSPSSEIILKSGEADDPASKVKIDAILDGCLTAARDDLALLKRAQKMKDPSSLSPDDLARLKDILEKNTYWRFLEAF